MKPDGQRFLRQLGERLRGIGSLECVGFTDSLGAAAYNERLGHARARTVCDFLAQVLAIRKALNRRVELTVRY